MKPRLDSVTMAAGRAGDHQRGHVRADAARQQVAGDENSDRYHHQQRVGSERVAARPHDDEHAEQADAGRRPPPPADLGAEEQRRAGRDGERRELQDAEDVADRHAAPARSGRAPCRRRRPRRARALPAESACGSAPGAPAARSGSRQARREHPAHEDRLARRQPGRASFTSVSLATNAAIDASMARDAAEVVRGGVCGKSGGHWDAAPSLTGKGPATQPRALHGGPAASHSLGIR